MIDLYNYVVAHWDDILLALTGLVTFASVVVKLTPTQVDDVVLQKVLDFFKLVALNKSK